MKTYISPLERKKLEMQRKLLWGALSIVAIIILFGAFIILCCGSYSKKSEDERTVRNALRLKYGDNTLKILDISEPDSVFYNRMCPEDEVMELSERFLTYSMTIMQDSQTELLTQGNDECKCKMDRYSATSNTLNILNKMLEKPAGKHCGWRVKVKYQTVDDSGTPYVTETWYIFDRRKKHIINSFDICI